MEEHLPSYEAATTQDPWPLVATRIYVLDLRSAVLVCRRWHTLFTPLLWHDPVRINPSDPQLPWRFIQGLPGVREAVRERTKVLVLPNNEPNVCDSPTSTWLRDALIGLPRLAALSAWGSPYLDHSSLSAVCQGTPDHNAKFPGTRAVYDLRLLNASSTANITSATLESLLPRLQSLEYLNLSGTIAARNSNVLRSLMYVNLKCLELSGMGLKDEDVDQLCTFVTLRLRSLDLSNNPLTDASVPHLAKRRRLEVGMEHGSASDRNRSVHEFRNWLGKQITEIDHADNHLAYSDHPGLQELFLSETRLTIEAGCQLLRFGQLHRLDIGQWDSSSNGSIHSLNDDAGSLLNGVTFQPLSCLRIHHSLAIFRAPESPVIFVHLPSLKTLILTEVPMQSTTSALTEQLVSLIRFCAGRMHEVTLQAQASYELPPGRNRATAERDFVRSRFPLREIVFQMAPRRAPVSEAKSGPAEARAWNFTGTSITEDLDSAILHQAGENDFSFFDETSRTRTAPVDTSVRDSGRGSHAGTTAVELTSVPIDTIAALKKFREEAKAAYNAAIALNGSTPKDNCGHWPGMVVVRRR